ncbi:putative ciliary rootlet coiled-coil protein 2 isoform X3 [Rana temporaria]|uniref:putative ciliary rootlet coiled-coil protein 2 isoform X3 n=1 Tax=Rana temporaria TaxID=8407 RepID=UPI001AACD8FC|nr:putative ciliary rootlet coiled-coil protein 2 isoform X3 [Rana temporaria]
MENSFMYHLDEADSGCPSCSSSPRYFEDELKNEFAWSENRRFALHQSLRNARHALQHQNDCLQQQQNDKANSDVTLEQLLRRQEILESRFSYLRNNNFSPGFVSRNITGTKENQCIHFLPAITDSSRITDLEREINDINMKMRRYSLLKENNVHRWNLYEERKKQEAENAQMQEELRQHAELVEAKCNNAQREKDALELEITSLHSGLHREKVTSKELEKKCVKLQSQILANRNINESLHLEVSALKKHSHTLENAVTTSTSEKKSLHSQIKNLQQENQSLCSQKELLYSIMKKKGKRKHHREEQSKGATRDIQIEQPEDNSCVSPIHGSLLSGSSCDSSFRNSRRPQKLRRKKEVKRESKDDDRKDIDGLQLDCESKRSEMNAEIILSCYQHLADLLRKLECHLKSNVKLDKEKEQIFTFLLGTVKELQDGKLSSNKSRDQVEELLNERKDLRENYHMRLNQDSLKLLKLHDQAPMNSQKGGNFLEESR